MSLNLKTDLAIPIACALAGFTIVLLRSWIAMTNVDAFVLGLLMVLTVAHVLHPSPRITFLRYATYLLLFGAIYGLVRWGIGSGA